MPIKPEREIMPWEEGYKIDFTPRELLAGLGKVLVAHQLTAQERKDAHPKPYFEVSERPE